MRADAVGAQAQQQVAAPVQYRQRGAAVGKAGIGQLACGVQIEVGMAWQLRCSERTGADGEAQEQGMAGHKDDSGKQAATVASQQGQKPHNLMTGL